MEIKKNGITSPYLFAAAIIILLSVGCSATKSVPANDALYTGANLKLENYKASKKQKKFLKADLQALIHPKPNSRILGIPIKLLN